MSKQQTLPQTDPSRSEDTVPGLKEGYLVDRFYSYSEPVDFVNEKKGIRKPIIRNHEFVGFPGVDEATEEGRRYNKHSNRSYSDWMDFVERKPVGARFYYRVEFSRPDEQGQTRVLWMLQPHDTPDEDRLYIQTGKGKSVAKQMQTYLVIKDFRRKVNKRGGEYGMPVCIYSKPEDIRGYDMVTSGYCEEPAVSRDRIFEQVFRLF